MDACVVMNITHGCTGHGIHAYVVSTSCRSPMHGLVNIMDHKDVKALAGTSMHIGTIGTLIVCIVSQMALVDTSIPRLPAAGAEEEDALDEDDMPRKMARVEDTFT